MNFNDVSSDASLHRKLLYGLQKLRGRIYLQDGAIRQDQLSPDGRHVQDADYTAWHLLTLDEKDQVMACARYHAHDNSVAYSQLSVARSAMSKCPVWGRKIRAAIEGELRTAKIRRCAFVEVGGLALDESLWGSTEAVRMIIALFSLSQLLGEAIGISTATTRHSSSSILRRIGGRSLATLVEGQGNVELPPYFDAQYGCEMEVLRFDSRKVNPRFARSIEDSRDALMSMPVVCAESNNKLRLDLVAMQNAVVESKAYEPRTLLSA